jgi:hypothetical protein
MHFGAQEAVAFRVGAAPDPADRVPVAAPRSPTADRAGHCMNRRPCAAGRPLAGLP